MNQRVVNSNGFLRFNVVEIKKLEGYLVRQERNENVVSDFPKGQRNLSLNVPNQSNSLKQWHLKSLRNFL